MCALICGPSALSTSACTLVRARCLPLLVLVGLQVDAVLGKEELRDQTNSCPTCAFMCPFYPLPGDSPSSLPTTTSARAYFTQRVRRQKAAQEASFSAAPPTAEDEEGLAAEAELAAEERLHGEGDGEEEEAGGWRHRIMGVEELEALEVGWIGRTVYHKYAALCDLMSESSCALVGATSLCCPRKCVAYSSVELRLQFMVAICDA
eukprot:1159797-Pelagomonas_calceolata.AAC.3